MKIQDPIVRATFLASAANSALAALASGASQEETFQILKAQVVDVAGGLGADKEPKDLHALALWCLRAAEEILEANTPTRNAAGVLVLPTKR